MALVGAGNSLGKGRGRCIREWIHQAKTSISTVDIGCASLRCVWFMPCDPDTMWHFTMLLGVLSAALLTLRLLLWLLLLLLRWCFMSGSVQSAALRRVMWPTLRMACVLHLMSTRLCAMVRTNIARGSVFLFHSFFFFWSSLCGCVTVGVATCHDGFALVAQTTTSEQPGHKRWWMLCLALVAACAALTLPVRTRRFHSTPMLPMLAHNAL